MKQKLKISEIRIDGNTQPRANINNEVVAEYAEDIKAGKPFPPMEVYFDGTNYWLSDGFHRRHAYVRADVSQVECEIKTGSLQEAQWASYGKNQEHGLRRTNADKTKAVDHALKMRPEFSDHVIANHCGVTHPFVAKRRAQVVTVTTSIQNVKSEKRTGMDNKQYPVPEPEKEPSVIPFPPPPEPEKEPEIPGIPVDEIGREIPSAAMETWSRRGEADEVLSCISKVRSAVRTAMEKKDPFYGEISCGNILADLDSVYASLKLLKPYTVCPVCQGMSGCRLCTDRKMISKFKWETTVSDTQKKRAYEQVKR